MHGLPSLSRFLLLAALAVWQSSPLAATPAGITENQAGRPGVKSTDFDDSVAGIDRNGDGIRDDIETYIDRTYPDPRQKRAMKQFARIEQKYMVDADNRPQSIANTRVLFKAHQCLHEVFGKEWYRRANDVEAMFLNTENRFAAYHRAMNNSAGESYSEFLGEACE